METNNEYKSDVFTSIHETMEGLYNANIIDKVTIREFDKSCLVSPSELLR